MYYLHTVFSIASSKVILYGLVLLQYVGVLQVVNLKQNI